MCLTTKRGIMNLALINKENISIHMNTNNIIWYVVVRVTNIPAYAKEMKEQILDKSWITKLNGWAKSSYEARSKKTIEYLVRNVLDQVKNQVTSDFGEILVSMSAQDALEHFFDHKKLPLAELWKEKTKGNPGFDFHTETKDYYIVFGEAKYRQGNNPYNVALEQIKDFIENEKDKMELVDLKNLVSDNTKQWIDTDFGPMKAYAAAFSMKKGTNLQKNIENSVCLKQLLDQKLIFLIGVEI